MNANNWPRGGIGAPLIHGLRWFPDGVVHFVTIDEFGFCEVPFHGRGIVIFFDN